MGQPLETFVYQALKRQASWRADSTSFFDCRNRDGAEVEIVIERGTQGLAGVEVKAGAPVTSAEFRALRKVRGAAGGRFAGGAILYDGERSVPCDDGLYAAPLRLLGEMPWNMAAKDLPARRASCRL